MKALVVVAVGICALVAVLCNIHLGVFSVTVDNTTATSAALGALPQGGVVPIDEVVTDGRPMVQHVSLPKPVKAIYMTACVAGTPAFREKLVALMDTTEINAVVLDIKDYSGGISFPPENPLWQPAWEHAQCGARDMRDFIARLHSKNIFVIGRITVFQDPFWANEKPHLAVKRADGQTVWKDHKGLSFIDVAAKEYWEHVVALSVDAYNLGFDELNFDYVRYPSDGNMQDVSFPHTAGSQWPTSKAANLEAFFRYLHAELSKEERFARYRHEGTGRASTTPWLSADLFGMTTTNYDDLSIGQVLERALPYFDAVAPMVYPSHYPNNYLGLGNPNDHPYEIVYHAMASGVARATASTTPVNGFLHVAIASTSPVLYQKPVYGAGKLRTWIQDFDYGGDYTAEDVRAQITASEEAGVMDWMIWAPSNVYTRAALRE